MQPTFEGFLQRVETTPQLMAIWVEGESLSFSELHTQLTEIGERLHATRAEQNLDGLMPILVERTLKSAVSILAAYFAGIPFAVLDEGTPPEYARELLSRIDVQHPIWQPESHESTDGIPRLQLSENRRPIPPVDADGFALAILTSGSVGIPKAVMHSRNSIIASRAYRFPNAGEIEYSELNVTPFAFAVGLLSLLAISLGVSTYNLKPANYSPHAFFELIRTLKPARIYMPSQFARLYGQRVVDPVIEGVKQIRVGGEAVRIEHVRDLARAFSPDTLFQHTLGSSEGSCEYMWQKYAHEMVGTGQVELTRHPDFGLLLERDEYGEGVFELYSGFGVSLGYYSNPQLTEERFMTIDGRRWWKSGDLLKRVGENEYLHYGRIDDLVKISGYLVSPATVSNALMSLPDVSMAITVSEQDGDRYILNAYVEVHNDSNADANSLKIALLELVPAYMIPQNLSIVDEIPMTVRGKTDRKLLKSQQGESRD